MDKNKNILMVKGWVDDISIDEVTELLKPYEAKDMKIYEISMLANSPINNSLEIVNPIKIWFPDILQSKNYFLS